MRVTVPVGNDQHQLDLQPAGTRDGKRVWTARCRLPMQGLLGGGLRVVRDAATAGAPQVREAVAATASGPTLLEGYASSTSVDWHGTEMTREALDSMARQMAAGVPYVPSHYDDEWEQVMGRTVEARVEQGTIVRDGGTGAQADGYRLAVRVELYPEHPRSQQLLQAVQRGQVVGMSIGGWFTDAEVETNDRDEVERIYIKAVELDHLAVTRRPSNPDSWIAGLARSTGEALAAARAAGSPAYLGGAVQGMDTRHMDVNVSINVCQHKNETEVEGSEAEAEDAGGEAMPYNESMGGERAVGDAPNYHLSDNTTQRCGTCTHRTRDGWCKAFDFACAAEWVCDGWQRATADELVDGGSEGTAPTQPDEQREVSGNVDLPLAPEDTAWGWDTDAANEVLGDPPDWERYAMAHLWVDTANPERRASYKLPFAKIVQGELHIVFRGVAAAMGALNGARGGVDLPDADRPKVYERITELYQRFDKEPPELLRAGDTALDNAGAQGSTATSMSDAVESAALQPPSSEDNAMTDNRSTATDTQRMDNLERAIGELNGVLSKLVERVAPTATHTAPVADEAAELRAQLEAKDAQLTRALAAASRQGVAHSPHAHRHTDVGGHGALIRSVERTMGAGSALVQVARSQAERRDSTVPQTRAQLEADLRSLLAAAFADGVITDSYGMEG